MTRNMEVLLFLIVMGAGAVPFVQIEAEADKP